MKSQEIFMPIWCIIQRRFDRRYLKERQTFKKGLILEVGILQSKCFHSRC